MKLIQLLLAMMFLATNCAYAADTRRDKLLKDAREASALDLLSSYQQSQMMLMYAELAESGITIQTPEGRISKRKAKKMTKEHQQKVEVCEQVMRERGFQDLEGEYTFTIKGDCAGAKAFWAQLGASEDCQDPTIRQDGMSISVMHPCTHKGNALDVEYKGTTFDDAAVFTEEMNSDYRYSGTIKDGVIKLRPDAEGALASWPSFDKPPGRKALQSCEITMAPKTAHALE